MRIENSLQTIGFIQKISDSAKSMPIDCLLPKFVAAIPPRISLQQYAIRISSKSSCSEACFVLATIYIERLLAKRVVVNQYSVHRIFLVSTLLAIKYLEDDCFDNKWYATFGGVSLSELNSLEQDMLEFLEYRLVVTSEEYNGRSSGIN